MFARFDENPAMTLQDIKETKRYGRTHGRTHGWTDGQRENSIPTTNKVCGGIITQMLMGWFWPNLCDIESPWYLLFVPRMNQIWPIGTEIWFLTDKKCGRTDGQKDGRNGHTDGRIDDAKTISLRLRRVIKNRSLKAFLNVVQNGIFANFSLFWWPYLLLWQRWKWINAWLLHLSYSSKQPIRRNWWKASFSFWLQRGPNQYLNAHNSLTLS